jgi:hypothetical protein
MLPVAMEAVFTDAQGYTVECLAGLLCLNGAKAQADAVGELNPVEAMFFVQRAERVQNAIAVLQCREEMRAVEGQGLGADEVIQEAARGAGGLTSRTQGGIGDAAPENVHPPTACRERPGGLQRLAANRV